MPIRPEISAVLAAIPELAHVAIHGQELTYTAPRYNLWEVRAAPVLSYLRRYSQLRGFTGEYFLCLYDGWREYTEPFANPIFVPWRRLMPPDTRELGPRVNLASYIAALTVFFRYYRYPY